MQLRSSSPELNRVAAVKGMAGESGADVAGLLLMNPNERRLSLPDSALTSEATTTPSLTMSSLLESQV